MNNYICEVTLTIETEIFPAHAFTCICEWSCGQINDHLDAHSSEEVRHA